VRKALAIFGILMCAAWGMAMTMQDATLHPMPSVHPDAVPDPDGSIEFRPGNYNIAAPSEEVAGIYDDAVAVYTFNDPADLGDDAVGTNDLTLVNTPTATGGALGYVADFEDGSNQRAIHATGPDITDEDFGACLWVVKDSVGINGGLFGETGDASVSNWLIAVLGTNQSYMCIHNGADVQKCASSAAADLVVGQRYFLCGYHDAAGDKVYIVQDDVAMTNFATGGGIQTGAQPLEVARYGEHDGLDTDGKIGPIWLWDGSYDTTDFTILYNDGKGYTCADAPALTDPAEHCWEMDEDGGPYVDSIGSLDLTGVNTPTQAVGLVENDQGMGVRLEGGTSSHLISSATGWARGDADLTVVMWTLLHTSAAGSTWQAVGYDASVDFDFLIGRTSSQARCGKENDAGGLEYAGPHADLALNLDEWHMVTLRYTASTNLLECSVDAGSWQTKTLASDAMAMVGDHKITVGYTAGVSNAVHDNVAIWNDTVKSDADITTLYNSGAGTFYAAFMDFIFNGPRFAWSAKPEIRRIDS